MNKHCLCFQYGTVNVGQLSFDNSAVAKVSEMDDVALDRTVRIAASNPTGGEAPLVTLGSITDPGALITAVDGECVD